MSRCGDVSKGGKRMQAVHRELVVYDLEASSAEEAIRVLGGRLFDGGYVRDTYTDAVVARERDYPTGLQLKTVGIAMPHTTGAHVIIPAVCVARLRQPIEFSHMGDGSIKVQAEMLFMMAIKDPNDQLKTLQSMMAVFGDDEALGALLSARDEDELYQEAKVYIG